MANTDEQQVPWESSSLTGDFYFAAAEEAAGTTETIEVQTSTVSAEAALWAAIESSSNPVDYMTYLAEYPDGTFAALARARIESTQVATASQETREASTTELTFWDAIKNSSNAADYEAYVAQYPDGTFATLALNRLAMLQAGTAPVVETQQQASLPDPAEEDTGFDGERVIKMKGSRCPVVGRAKGKITASNSILSGAVKIGTYGMIRLNGTILPSGKLDGASPQGRYHLNLSGGIEGDGCRGKWRVPNGDCSGTFSLTRVGGG